MVISLIYACNLIVIFPQQICAIKFAIKAQTCSECLCGGFAGQCDMKPTFWGENDQIPPIKKLEFYENSILASATYEQLVKKVSEKFAS